MADQVRILNSIKKKQFADQLNQKQQELQQQQPQQVQAPGRAVPSQQYTDFVSRYTGGSNPAALSSQSADTLAALKNDYLRARLGTQGQMTPWSGTTMPQQKTAPRSGAAGPGYRPEKPMMQTLSDRLGQMAGWNGQPMDEEQANFTRWVMADSPEEVKATQEAFIGKPSGFYDPEYWYKKNFLEGRGYAAKDADIRTKLRSYAGDRWEKLKASGAMDRQKMGTYGLSYDEAQMQLSWKPYDEGTMDPEGTIDFVYDPLRQGIADPMNFEGQDIGSLSYAEYDIDAIRRKSQELTGWDPAAFADLTPEAIMKEGQGYIRSMRGRMAQQYRQQAFNAARAAGFFDSPEILDPQAHSLESLGEMTQAAADRAEKLRGLVRGPEEAFDDGTRTYFKTTADAVRYIGQLMGYEMTDEELQDEGAVRTLISLGKIRGVQGVDNLETMLSNAGSFDAFLQAGPESLGGVNEWMKGWQESLGTYIKAAEEQEKRFGEEQERRQNEQDWWSNAEADAVRGYANMSLEEGSERYTGNFDTNDPEDKQKHGPLAWMGIGSDAFEDAKAIWSSIDSDWSQDSGAAFKDDFYATDEEKARFKWTFVNEGALEAKTYWESVVRPRLMAQRAITQEAQVRTENLNPGGAVWNFVQDRGRNVIGAVQAPFTFVGALAGADWATDPNSGWNTNSRLMNVSTQDLNRLVGEKATELLGAANFTNPLTGQTIAQDLFSGLTSAVDSLIGVYLGGATLGAAGKAAGLTGKALRAAENIGGLLFMGNEAFSNSYVSHLEQGDSAELALKKALLDAAIESASEVISVDKVLHPGAIRNGALHLLTLGGVEASEEAVGWAMSNLGGGLEYLLFRDDSDDAQALLQYIAEQGFTLDRDLAKEGQKVIDAQNLQELGQGAIGGFIGGVAGGGTSLAQTMNQYSQTGQRLNTNAAAARAGVNLSEELRNAGIRELQQGLGAEDLAAVRGQMTPAAVTQYNHDAAARLTEIAASLPDTKAYKEARAEADYLIKKLNKGRRITTRDLGRAYITLSEAVGGEYGNVFRDAYRPGMAREILQRSTEGMTEERAGELADQVWEAARMTDQLAQEPATPGRAVRNHRLAVQLNEIRQSRPAWELYTAMTDNSEAGANTRRNALIEQILTAEGSGAAETLRSLEDVWSGEWQRSGETRAEDVNEQAAAAEQEIDSRPGMVDSTREGGDFTATWTDDEGNSQDVEIVGIETARADRETAADRMAARQQTREEAPQSEQEGRQEARTVEDGETPAAEQEGAQEAAEPAQERRETAAERMAQRQQVLNGETAAAEARTEETEARLDEAAEDAAEAVEARTEETHQEEEAPAPAEEAAEEITEPAEEAETGEARAQREAQEALQKAEDQARKTAEAIAAEAVKAGKEAAQAERNLKQDGEREQKIGEQLQAAMEKLNELNMAEGKARGDARATIRTQVQVQEQLVRTLLEQQQNITEQRGRNEMKQKAARQRAEALEEQRQAAEEMAAAYSAFRASMTGADFDAQTRAGERLDAARQRYEAARTRTQDTRTAARAAQRETEDRPYSLQQYSVEQADADLRQADLETRPQEAGDTVEIREEARAGANRVLVTVRTADGTERKVNPAALTRFKSRNTAAIMLMSQSAAGVLPAGEMNAMLKASAGKGAGFAADFDAAYTAGFDGRSVSREIVGRMGETEAEQARTAGELEGRKAEAARLASIAEEQDRRAAREPGRVTLDGVKAGDLNGQQKAFLKLARQLSRVTGIGIRIVDRADGVNGWYADGEIVVNISAAVRSINREALEEQYKAEHNGEEMAPEIYTAARVLGHELTHYIENHSAEGYARLRRFVMEELERKGENFNALVRAKQELQHRYWAEGKVDSLLTREGAISEVIADSMELMLSQEETQRRLEEKDRGLFGTIREHVGKILQDIKDAIRDAFHLVGPGHRESRALMVQRNNVWEYCNEAVSLWNAALEEAVSPLEELKQKQQERREAAFEERARKQEERDEEYRRFREEGTAEENAPEGAAQYQLVGVDPTSGLKIYRSNYETGTPAAEIQKNTIKLIQEVWSRAPITLTVIEDGKARTIEARFDPDFDETGVRKTDAGKIAYGNRKGNKHERRIALNLSNDYYEILEESTYHSSAPESGKESETHTRARKWHYFLNDLMYQEREGAPLEPYRMEIDIKETDTGAFVYAFGGRIISEEKIKKLAAPQYRTRVNRGGLTTTAANGQLSEEDYTEKSGRNNSESGQNAQRGEEEAENEGEGASYSLAAQLGIEDLLKQMEAQADESDRLKMDKPVEVTEHLIAVHNLSAENLWKCIRMGGIPMPSMAVVNAAKGWEWNKNGISVIFGREAVDPQLNPDARLYGNDTFTPTLGNRSYRTAEDALRFLMEQPETDTGVQTVDRYRRDSVEEVRGMLSQQRYTLKSREEYRQKKARADKASAKLAAYINQRLEPIMEQMKAEGRLKPDESTAKGSFWEDIFETVETRIIDGHLSGELNIKEALLQALEEQKSKVNLPYIQRVGDYIRTRETLMDEAGAVIPAEVVREVGEAYRELGAVTPRDMVEAKTRQIFRFGQDRMAFVVPMDTDPALVRELKRQGCIVHKYDNSTYSAQREAQREAAIRYDMAFSLTGDEAEASGREWVLGLTRETAGSEAEWQVAQGLQAAIRKSRAAAAKAQAARERLEQAEAARTEENSGAVKEARKALQTAIREARDAEQALWKLENSGAGAAMLQQSREETERLARFMEELKGKGSYSREGFRQKVNDELERVQNEIRQSRQGLEERRTPDRQHLDELRGLVNQAQLKRLAEGLRGKIPGTAMAQRTVENELLTIAAELTEGREVGNRVRGLAEAIVYAENRRAAENTVLENLSVRIRVTPEVREWLKNRDLNMNSFNRQYGQWVRLTNDQQASPADVAWQELSNAEGWQYLQQYQALSLGEIMDRLTGMVDAGQQDVAGQRARMDEEARYNEELQEETARQFFPDVMEAVSEVSAMLQGTTPEQRIRRLNAKLRQMERERASLHDMLEETEKQLQAVNAAAREQNTGMSQTLKQQQEKIRKALEGITKERQQLRSREAALTLRAQELQRTQEAMKNAVALRQAESMAQASRLVSENREAWMTAMNNAQLIRNISRVVGRINHRIRRETDRQNVKEELKPLAAAVVATFAHEDSKGPAIAFSPIAAAQLAMEYDELRTHDQYLADFLDETQAEQLEGIRQQIEAYQKINIRSMKGKLEALRQREAILQNILEYVQGVEGLITAADRAFLNGREVQIGELADGMAAELKRKKNATEWNSAAGKGARAAQTFAITNNLTPEYFIRSLDSETMSGLWQDFLDGQSSYGLLLRESRKRMEDSRRARHYYEWVNRAPLTYTNEQGREVTLTAEQAMSLYASWTREHGEIRSEHLEKGGFVLNEQQKGRGLLGRVEQTDMLHSGTKVSQADIDRIGAWLTDDMKGYISDMVGYMSRDLSRLGNEVSMKLYGIRKYTEEYYFPFRVWSGALHPASDAGSLAAEQENRKVGNQRGNIKNGRFTKRRMSHARNPLLLEDFSEVVAGHMAEMLSYNSFVTPNESLNRMLNADVAINEEGDTMKVEEMFRQKYGEHYRKYLRDFMQDLSGGAITDTRERAASRFISLFKKGAVAASLSVAMQQPLSLIRAGTVISPKYLAAAAAKLKGAWSGSYNEALSWSGTAVIKKMGKFDTGVGYGAAAWIQQRDGDDYTAWMKAKELINVKDREAFRDRWSEIVSWLPGKMDEVTWGKIWEAVKLEQKALDPGADVQGEAFLKKCGRRFDEIMTQTQVYDSTLTRSGNMRSKSAFMQSITAFMAEPTVTFNTLYDAWTHKQKSGVGHMNKAAVTVSFLVSAVLQAAVKAAWSAGRKDDEEKTLEELVLGYFGSNLMDEINPLSSIPGIRDLWSMLMGDDVTRSDLSIWSEILQNGKKLQKYMAGEAGGFNGPWQAVEQFGGSVAKLAGLPLKNVMRDCRALYNFFMHKAKWDRDKEFSGSNAWYTFKDAAFTGILYDSSDAAYYGRYYAAVRDGRDREAEDLLEYITTGRRKSEASIKTGVKKAMKADLQSGAITAMEAAELMERMGLYEDKTNKAGETTRTARQQAYEWAVSAGAPEPAEGEEQEKPSAWDPLYAAARAGKDETAARREMKAAGWTDEQMDAQIKGQVDDWYRAGDITADRAEALLQRFGATPADTHWKIKQWNAEAAATDPGYSFSRYDDFLDSIEAGSGSGIRDGARELRTYWTGKADSFKSTMASQISQRYKQRYISAGQSERARLLPWILTAYEAIGYDREKEREYILKNWK